MRRKIINFEYKKLFKTKEIDVNKILVSKKESYGTQKIHLNTSLDIMMMMSLDHYV